MKKLDLTQLSIEELLIEQKKRKSSYNLFKFVIVLMICSAIFSTVMQGFSYFTLLPTFFVPIGISVKNQFDEVEKEIQSRT